MKTAESTKSYVFPVVLEDDGNTWRAYTPELEAKGAATRGHTREEALKNILEVLQMIIEEMIEDGEPLPKTATVFDQPVVAVSV